MNSLNPIPIFNLLQKTLFVEQRNWDHGKFFGGSKMTKGHHSFAK